MRKVVKRIKLEAYIGFRADVETVKKLEEILQIRGINNVSQAIREAIHVYHAILTGSKVETPGREIVINVQSPVINIVEARAVAAAKSETKIGIVIEELRNAASRFRASKSFLRSEDVARYLETLARRIESLV